ncbi:hypothetical protein BC939DRAFT_407744 [Gamsiella multidivaricata]|uniref:uncharacterized protein n=1 Tax=Gamsiella multidivaricata TaxID=101098 RepID=UPI00221E947F|nr:uncharacterized protein BC939DRAFT_407744 [Gamsiella multidivaricata]KAG0367774.1 hypothetical protein BGZ54_003267 [Gamsiella multidivaricata]KAI7829445.1 hypothetical protein BC939DRAFT_407744 [Gamsiella multidivaricata]
MHTKETDKLAVKNNSQAPPSNTIDMDPSAPAASSTPAAQSDQQPAISETSQRSGNPRRGGRSNQQSGQKESQGKGRGSNNHRNDNRRKDKDKDKTDSSTAPALNSRAPRTIAATDPVDLQAGKTLPTSDTSTEAIPAAAAGDENAEQHSCFICTENIVIFAVSDCNHRTCHLCSLRLRALYKTKNCAYCKADQGIMIFTRDPEKAFQDYDLKQMAYFDRKLNVYFEDQEMYEDTMVLLRFNCPDPTCEVACPDGWNQLKSHVKKVHKLMLCDLCVRHKKVFAHEHNLMTASQLMKHFKNGDSGQTNQNSAEPSGFNGHPECGFCKESFYGDDELFEHCKKNHEQCFLCLRRNIRHQYYNKYPDLERHLHSEHYACMDPECLEKKFVVFDSDLDLKAHEAEMHPNSTHGQRTRLRDARKIDISFNYQSTSESSGSRRGGRNNRQNGRDQGQSRRAQEEEVPRQPQLTPHQVQQIALQQQMAEEQQRRNNNEIQDAAQEGVSNLSLDSSASGTKSMMRTKPPTGFGSSLTEPTPVRPQSSATSAAARVAAGIQRTASPMRPSSPVVVNQSKAEWPAVSAASAAPVASTASPISRPQSSSGASSSRGDVASETVNKHAALQDRVQQYLQGSSGTLSQFRTLTTQYRNSQIPANQYIASLSSLFLNDLDKTGKIIQGLYDVLDSESKKVDMMRAWRDYKTVQTQFPSLESTATSSPTMADIVTPSTRRVLVIKSSGTTRGGLGHSKPKSTATWDRAAAAAASLNRTSSPSGSKSTATPVFYPTPQLNSSAAWSLPRGSGDSAVPEPSLGNGSSTNQSSNTNVGSASRGQSTSSWAGISQSSSGKSSPTPQFRPSSSTGGRGRIGGTAEQFPSLVGQAPVGGKPSLGLLPMQKSRSNQANQDDAPNGWVMGWSNLTADQGDGEEETAGGKKKKNKKKILFHVG